MAAGAEWCSEIDVGSGLSLRIGLTPGVPVLKSQGLQEMVQAIGDINIFDLACVVDGRWRVLAVDSRVGIVSVIEGGRFG